MARLRPESAAESAGVVRGYAERAEVLRRRAEAVGKLAEGYESARRSPWLPVPPDPPEPE